MCASYRPWAYWRWKPVFCLFVSCVCVLYTAQHSFLHFGNARYTVAEGWDESRGLVRDINMTRWAEGSEGQTHGGKEILETTCLPFSPTRGVRAASEGMEVACRTETFGPYLPKNSIFSNKDQVLEEWMDSPHLSAPWLPVFLRCYGGDWLSNGSVMARPSWNKIGMWVFTRALVMANLKLSSWTDVPLSWFTSLLSVLHVPSAHSQTLA